MRVDHALTRFCEEDLLAVPDFLVLFHVRDICITFNRHCFLHTCTSVYLIYVLIYLIFATIYVIYFDVEM